MEKPLSNEDDDSKAELVELEKAELIARLEKVDPFIGKKLAQIFKVKSTETYYSSEAAEAIRPIIDDMIADEMDIQLRYEDYYKWKPDTIRQKIYSGIKYLVDNLDTDGRYKKWRSRVEIKRNNEGVKIEFVKDKVERTLVFKAHKIKKNEDGTVTEINPDEPVLSSAAWKDELMNFIEHAKENEARWIKNIKLNEEDKNWIRELFSELEQFTVRGDTNQVKVIHAQLEGIRVDIK